MWCKGEENGRNDGDDMRKRSAENIGGTSRGGGSASVQAQSRNGKGSGRGKGVDIVRIRYNRCHR